MAANVASMATIAIENNIITVGMAALRIFNIAAGVYTILKLFKLYNK